MFPVNLVVFSITNKSRGINSNVRGYKSDVIKIIRGMQSHRSSY